MARNTALKIAYVQRPHHKNAAGLLALKIKESLSKQSRRTRRSLLLAIASLLAITATLCAPIVQASSVRLLVSGEESYYRDTQTSFTETLLSLSPDTVIRVTTVDSNTLTSADELPPWPEDIVVTIGTPAAELAQHIHSDKTLHLFITNDVWQRLSNGTQNPQKAAVVLDQPPSRIMLLAKILSPQARNIATVLGPSSGEDRDQLEKAAKDLELSLDAKIIGLKDNPVAIMSPLIEKNDIFIAVPDSAIFNRATAKWALYLGFRSNTPVVGFSKAYTDAGALASIYASPSNIGHHGGELAAKALALHGEFEAGLHFPRYYTLRANPSVAKALNIKLPNDATLYRMYEDALAKTP